MVEGKSQVKSYVVGLEKSQSKLEQEYSQLRVGCYQGKKKKEKKEKKRITAPGTCPHQEEFHSFVRMFRVQLRLYRQ